jgi:hypothetical protein
MEQTREDYKTKQLRGMRKLLFVFSANLDERLDWDTLQSLLLSSPFLFLKSFHVLVPLGFAVREAKKSSNVVDYYVFNDGNDMPVFKSLVSGHEAALDQLIIESTIFTVYSQEQHEEFIKQFEEKEKEINVNNLTTIIEDPIFTFDLVTRTHGTLEPGSIVPKHYFNLLGVGSTPREAKENLQEKINEAGGEGQFLMNELNAAISKKARNLSEVEVDSYLAKELEKRIYDGHGLHDNIKSKR